MKILNLYAGIGGNLLYEFEYPKDCLYARKLITNGEWENLKMNTIKFLELLIKIFANLLECTKKIRSFAARRMIREYYVYNPDGKKPKYIHYNYESALNEAERIANLEPEIESDIQILEIITSVKKRGIPF